MPVKRTPMKKTAAGKKTTLKKKAAPKKKAVTKKTATRKPVARKKTATKTTPKKKTARKPSAAFMKPMQPDGALAAVVGSRPIPRTQITKKMWEYIKKNDLQNPANRREILADDKLKPIFGGKKKVNMFEMTKLISKHMK